MPRDLVKAFAPRAAGRPRPVAWLAALGAGVLAAGAGDTACLDVGKGEPRALVGTLAYAMFAGPPNFEDVRRGDTPEPSFILRLDQPICLTGDDFADEHPFREVQLVETPSVSAARLRALLGRNVQVTFSDRLAAETGHHHEPLVAWVAAITPVATAPAARMAQRAPKPLDFVDEYGTGATTVRAFYAALADGQGATAAAMVVPEKRRSGPLSAPELSRFYGGLKHPIRLADIAAQGPNVYVAHYRYASAGGACDGRAAVTVVSRGGTYLIASIRALNGC